MAPNQVDIWRIELAAHGNGIHQYRCLLSPDEIQRGDDDEDGKACPQCFGKMHFVAQIDSFEHNDENNPNRKDYADAQFMFGDVGMIYVWFCFNCLTPQATLESY